MMKKRLLFLMSLLALFTLSACGNRAETTESTTTISSSQIDIDTYVKRAQKFYNQKKYKQAIKALQSALNHDGANKNRIRKDIKGIKLLQEVIQLQDDNQTDEIKDTIERSNLLLDKKNMAFKRLKNIYDGLETVTSSSKVTKTSETTTSDATGNDLAASFSLSNGGADSTSNVSITVTNQTNKAIRVNSGQFGFIYADKTYGADTIGANYQESRELVAGATTTFSNVFSNFGDQRALYGFTVTYAGQNIINQPSQVPAGDTIRADIVNRLNQAEADAVQYQQQIAAEGGDPNSVQSTPAAVNFAATNLMTEYPDYQEFITETLRGMGY